jgi:PPOX class probable F420-dependent enzyme, Rv3369 family
MSALPGGAFGERVGRRLREDYAIWLVTVGADGTPQPNPVWFLWDGADSVLVYNRSDANRLPHVAARPNVALLLDGDRRGGDVVVLAGTAERAADVPPPDENPDYLAKYEAGMTRVSGSPAAFSAAYPVPLRIAIRRIRGH